MSRPRVALPKPDSALSSRVASEGGGVHSRPGRSRHGPTASNPSEAGSTKDGVPDLGEHALDTLPDASGFLVAQPDLGLKVLELALDLAQIEIETLHLHQDFGQAVDLVVGEAQIEFPRDAHY